MFDLYHALMILGPVIYTLPLMENFDTRVQFAEQTIFAYFVLFSDFLLLVICCNFVAYCRTLGARGRIF